MKIEITTKCNMRCKHCIVNSDPNGQNMDFELFKKVFDVEGLRKDFVSFGTGEPTMHPQLFDMIEYALQKGRRVHIVTNGANTDQCLVLADLAKEGAISCHLSLDKWHAPIDSKVVEAFKRDPENLQDQRAYRHTLEEDLKNHGRCDFGNEHKNKVCACSQRMVKIDGTILFCGCDSSKVIGTVLSGKVEITAETKSGCHSFWDGDVHTVGDGTKKIKKAFRYGDSHYS